NFPRSGKIASGDNTFQQIAVNGVGQRHLKVFGTLLLALNREQRIRVSRPGSTSQSVVNIKKQHALQVSVCLCASIQYHTKSSVDDLPPAYSSPIVDGNPGSAAE